MTSSDLIILEAINGLEGKIVALQSETNQKLDNLQTEIKDTRNELMTEIRVNQAETRAVHDKVNMGFSLMTIFLGIIGGIALLHPAIKALGEYFESKRKNYATVEQFQELKNLIDAKISER